MWYDAPRRFSRSQAELGNEKLPLLAAPHAKTYNFVSFFIRHTYASFGQARIAQVVNYRKFSNADPPRLQEAWNEIFTGRGAVLLHTITPLDRYILSKPYFDPNGLILAEDNGACVGFAHAGLSFSSQPSRGVVCIFGVRPSFRKQGIGTELLKRSEAYLKEKGAQIICAGEEGCANPFYLGLYGGSDSPGILRSDADANPFLTRHGYQVDRQILVLQRDLTKPLKVADPRFAGLRNRYDVRVRSPRKLDTLAQECSIGQVDPLEFYLQEKQSKAVIAHALAWEMEGFSWRWKHPSVGLTGFRVEPMVRKQGLGKFLLFTLLKQLQEQYCEIVEVHIHENNQEAPVFLRTLGFNQVDVGQVFVKRS